MFLVKVNKKLFGEYVREGEVYEVRIDKKYFEASFWNTKTGSGTYMSLSRFDREMANGNLVRVFDFTHS